MLPGELGPLSPVLTRYLDVLPMPIYPTALASPLLPSTRLTWSANLSPAQAECPLTVLSGVATGIIGRTCRR